MKVPFFNWILWAALLTKSAETFLIAIKIKVKGNF